MSQLPPLDSAWRPNTAGPDVDDVELIRTFIGWPAVYDSIYGLRLRLNEIANISPASVTQIQAWVDEIVILEQDHADAVSDGTAHLANAEEYEGPIPGTTPTRAQQLSQAGKLTWDTSLLKGRYRFSGSASSTADGQRNSRIALLTNRIIGALGIDPSTTTTGSSTMLLRS
ncbi:MAG: hypothetical protein RLZZ468_534 [Cyanobacteriota bacterium]|jgi:hypothetical protein